MKEPENCHEFPHGSALTEDSSASRWPFRRKRKLRRSGQFIASIELDIAFNPSKGRRKRGKSKGTLVRDSGSKVDVMKGGNGEN